MRILVTGASGYLGRHVVAAAKNHVVFLASRRWHSSGDNDLALGDQFWDSKVFSAALAKSEPDVVIHCAGITQSVDAHAYFTVNSALAAELLRAVEARGAGKRVMLIGSAAEYGIVAQADQPVAETHPCAPTTPYAVSKYAQTLLGIASLARGTQVLTARLFNPIGAGMPAHFALGSFAAQISRAAPGSIVRVGDLTAERDFLDVEEAARLLVCLAECAYWPWPVVNICSGEAWRLGALLDGLMAAVPSKDLRIVEDQSRMRPGDMRRLVGSTARLEELALPPRLPDFETLLRRIWEGTGGS